MDSNELIYAKGVLIRLAQAARGDRELARHIRGLVKETGILQVFAVDETPDLTELLEAGGVALLQAWLSERALAELKQIVAANGFDPEKTSARWRSPARFVELIMTHAVARWEEEDRRKLEEAYAAATLPQQPGVATGASWML